jgi:hypothetical protein
VKETSEEKQIREAVEQRKRRARELGIVDQVFRLYQEHLKYLRSDFGHDLNCMPKSVTSVSRCSRNGGSGSTEVVDISFGNETYSFSFSERLTPVPGEYWSTGSIEVKKDGVLLLEVQCMQNDDRYLGFTWEVSDVGAFIEGPWVADISRFAQQVFGRKSQQLADWNRGRKNTELEELKKKFGL